MSLTEIIFWLVYIGGCFGALRRPMLGIIVYILVYNLNPETQWWGRNVAALGLRTSMTVAVMTGLGIILTWRGMDRRQTHFPMLFSFMCLFLIYGFLTSMTGSHPTGNYVSQFKLNKLLRIYVFVFMMIHIIRTRRDFRALLWAWMAGTIYIGYQAWSGVGITLSGRLLAGGLGGPDFSEASGLSAHMIVMVALAGFLFYSSAGTKGKFFALLAAAFAVNTIVMTRTRNAVPGAVALIFFGIMRTPKGLRLKCLIGMFLGVMLASTLTDQGWWTRMETMKTPENDPSIVSRYVFWKAAIEMARNRPFGVGPGNFAYNLKYYAPGYGKRSAHSTYFECLGELGYPGLLLFLVIVTIAFWEYERARNVGKNWRLTQESDPELAQAQRELLLVSTACEVSLAGFLTCAIFTTRLWTESLWLLVGMGCCVRNIAASMRFGIESGAEVEEEPELASAEMTGVLAR